MHTILSNIISSMVYEFCLIFKFIKVISPLFQTAQLICWLARAFSPVFQVLYFIYQRGAGNRSSNFLEILINLCISQHLTQVPSTWMIIKWRRKGGIEGENRERRMKRKWEDFQPNMGYWWGCGIVQVI